MIQFVKYIFRDILFWLFLFFIQRQIFLYALVDDGYSISDLLMCNYHAFPMDIASVCYVLTIPILLLVVYFVKANEITPKLILFFSFFAIAFTSLLTVIDIGLFEAWGGKLNGKAISYLAYPKEALASTMSSPVFLLVSIWILQSVAGIWLYLKYFKQPPFKLRIYQKVIIPMVLFFLLIIGFRGGFQLYPINKSWSYFSKREVLNLAAVNSLWNFGELMFEKDEISSNPYRFFSDQEAEEVLASIHQTDESEVLQIFNTSKPNVVLIMLESWSGYIIEPLGGEKGVTPQFTELSKEGILFTNFYSTGFRTEQGLAALVSGFPSQPTTTIIRKFGKFDKLPSIVDHLGVIGYHSSYFYGGNLDFANTESYIESMGFVSVYGEDDFEFEKRTKWGAFDEELFNFSVAEMGQLKAPFFSIIVTVTSHEPFDAPVNEGFEGSLPQLYRNSVHYTDRCLGDFIAKAKKEDWYQNTVFFIVSDHGHYLPEKRTKTRPLRFRIPMLVVGGALKKELAGTQITKIGSQVDFSATLLAQLKIPANDFKWSKDLLNEHTPSFAFYAFNEGFGWVDSNQTLVYDLKLNDVIIKTQSELPDKDNQKYLTKGKAYLQCLLNEYINFNN